MGSSQLKRGGVGLKREHFSGVEPRDSWELGSKLNVIYRDQATEPKVSEELAAHQPPPYGGLLVPDSD